MGPPRRCAALDAHLPSSSGGSGGGGRLSLTNVKYAAKMAGCAASLTNNARLAVLADTYPAGDPYYISLNDRMLHHVYSTVEAKAAS